MDQEKIFRCQGATGTQRDIDKDCLGHAFHYSRTTKNPDGSEKDESDLQMSRGYEYQL